MVEIARSLDKLHRAKLLGVRKGNMFYAHPSEIQEMPGFNPRNYDTPAMFEHIRSLAEAYKAGRFVDPIVVQVIDSVIYVRDGHCRRRGMLLAIAEGADLEAQPLVEFRGDENDADALILTSQSGKKLGPLEVAAMYTRMQNRGKSSAQIAEVVSKTTQHVTDMLDMHTLPLEIKDLIEQEAVSATLALSMYRKQGTGAIEALKEGVEAAFKEGKSRVTQKKLKPHAQARNGAGVRYSKPIVTRVANYVHTIGSRLDVAQFRDDGSALVELTRDEVDALRLLRESLPIDEEKGNEQTGEVQHEITL